MLATTTLLLSCLLPQNPGVGVQIHQLPSTFRLGEVVRATLSVESQPRPDRLALPQVEGLVLRLGQPSTNRSMQFVNGRRSESFTWNYPLEVRATALGKFKLEPIEVSIGDKAYRTRARAVEVVKEVTGASFGKVVVRASNTRVYVHEPVHFAVECSIDGRLQLVKRMAQNGAQYFLVQMQAGWLTKMSGAQPIEQPDVDPGDQVNTVLNDTYLQPANVEVSKAPDGKPYRVFRYSKSFLPTRAGLRKLEAPVLKFSVETGRQTQGFGLFASPEVRDYLVYGQPLTIEVLALPSKGRPDPYFGGVGRFTIRAGLSKSQVKVGESLKLRVTIAGQGNTEYLQVPELGDLPGFHQLGKNTNREENEVVVTYDLMPTMASVSEIPALRWNFFDTTKGVEAYAEVSTRPLAIDVQAITGAASLDSLPGEAAKAVELGVDDIFDLRLSGVTAPVVAAPPASAGKVWLASLAPWLLALSGSLLMRSRQRRLADVGGRRSKAARRQFDAALAAGKEPLEALVAYLADRLNCAAAAIIEPELDRRLLAAGFDAEHSQRVRDVVESGVAARYSGAGGAGLDRSQIEALVDSLERAVVGPAPAGGALASVLLLVTGLLCSAADASAQEPSRGLSKGEAAYRARDYDTAAAEFAAAAEAGDRVAAYNLGNTRYRQGRFASALVAYERARLAMPRDAELLANIRLVREHLGLAGGEEAFAETIAKIRDSLTVAERFWLCVLLNAAAAALICFGGRRRWVFGGVVAAFAITAIVEVAALGPNRPPKGIVLDPQVAMRAEPDAALEPRLKMRAGVTVEVLGSGSGWTKIRAQGLTGYVKSDAIGVVD